jgi:thioredoxin reductase (NADPH)
VSVDKVERQEDGLFFVSTSQGEYRSLAVILAIGRAGTPRKLGVKGEDLPHVFYRLIEATITPTTAF